MAETSSGQAVPYEGTDRFVTLSVPWLYFEANDLSFPMDLGGWVNDFGVFITNLFGLEPRSTSINMRQMLFKQTYVYADRTLSQHDKLHDNSFISSMLLIKAM